MRADDLTHPDFAALVVPLFAEAKRGRGLYNVSVDTYIFGHSSVDTWMGGVIVTGYQKTYCVCIFIDGILNVMLNGAWPFIVSYSVKVAVLRTMVCHCTGLALSIICTFGDYLMDCRPLTSAMLRSSALSFIFCPASLLITSSTPSWFSQSVTKFLMMVAFWTSSEISWL